MPPTPLKNAICITFFHEKWLQNRLQLGSRGVQNRQKLGSGDPEGVQGGPGGVQGAPGDTKWIKGANQKKTGDPSGGDFGRFWFDFGVFVGVPGGPKWGLKRCRFSGSENSRIFIKFSSKSESKKGHNLNTFEYTL